MSTRLPAIAPMMISSRATDTAIQACSEAAVSARPIHSADANQMLSIPNLSSASSGGSPQIQAPGGQNKTRQAAGFGQTPRRVSTQQESSALAGGYRGTPSPWGLI